MPETDEQLVVELSLGNEDALAELLRRYERPVTNFIFRHTGGRDVEDLYQETWLRVVRSAARFDASKRFSTWLFQIAVNVCRDFHRRRPPDPAEPAVEAASEGPASDARIDARRLLARLPEPQREALILRYYHDLNEDEIAAVAGCPRGTVKSRLHHALRRLNELIRETERR